MHPPARSTSRRQAGRRAAPLTPEVPVLGVPVARGLLEPRRTSAATRAGAIR